MQVAVQVANTDLTVLINGESGVGKEVFSNIIHTLSARKHNPFIAVNCGAIPEGTIDSELFGHEKGSFTGAVDARKGYFETVNGGTIFLDEIGELPLGTQARLLRVLEAGEEITATVDAGLPTRFAKMSEYVKARQASRCVGPHGPEGSLAPGPVT